MSSCATFEEQGFVRLKGVFSPAEAAAMEEHLWRFLARKHGVERDDPATWSPRAGTHLQSVRTHPVFAPIGSPVLLETLDGLFGPGRWAVPGHWGQFLVSFPSSDPEARSRSIWHTDFPYHLPAAPLMGALVISFIGAVPENAGGTLAIAGSHRLVARFLEARPRLREVKFKVTRQALMASDPWLESISFGWTDEHWPARLPRGPHDADGIPLEVVELSGEPGDVVVAHPWMLHSPAPNRGTAPRFMRVARLRAQGRAAA